MLADPQTTLANIESNLNLKHHLRQLILNYDEAIQLIATFLSTSITTVLFCIKTGSLNLLQDASSNNLKMNANNSALRKP